MSTQTAGAPRATTSAGRGAARRTLRRRAGLAAVAALSTAVVAYALIVYAGFDPSTSQVELREDVPWHHGILMAHILTAAVALALGPLQLSRRVRVRRRVHRWVGRGYLFLGVLPSTIVGIPTALLSTGGAWASAGLLVGDLLWLGTAVVAYRAARAHRYRDHARWMTRNFALTFSAVTFRVWLPLLLVVQLPVLEAVHGGDFERLFHAAYTATTWLAFLPNVAVVALAQRGRRPAA